MGVHAISFQTNPVPGIAVPLIAVLYKESARNVEIDRRKKDPPHNNQYTWQFSELEAGNYLIAVHRSPDGISLGNKEFDFLMDAETNQIILEVIPYNAGGAEEEDPAIGSNIIVDEYLIGKNIVMIHKVGFRPLVPGEFTHAGNTVEVLVGGPFGEGETLVVQVQYPVTSTGSESTGSFPADFVEMVGNLTITSEHYNKIIEANGAAAVITASFPNLATLQDGKMFGFNTHKGNQRYLAISMTGGDRILIDGAEKNIVWMGKGASVTFMKKGGYLKVVNDGDIFRKRVGETVRSELASINCIAETGGWYLIDEYPRLFNEYVNKLPPGELGTAVYPAVPDANNRVKWIISGIRFWVPDTGGYIERNTDPNGDVDIVRSAGDRKALSLQVDSVGPHRHYRLTKMKTGGHANSSNALSGEVRVLVNTVDSGGQNTGNMFLEVDPDPDAKETVPKNINRNVFRII